MPALRNRRTLSLVFTLVMAALVLLPLARANAQSSDDQKLARGAQLYAENCAVCHGPNGEGRVGATLAKNWSGIRPDLAVQTIIENGIPGSPMTAWSQANGGPLSAEDIEAMVFFILSWQTGGFVPATSAAATPRPPITPLPEVQGDPNQGAVLYDQNCLMCHGPNGEGRVGATLAKVWGGFRPDLSVKSTIQNGIANSAMPAWSQAKGGPLTETEIDNLTAYILTWENSPIRQVQPAQPTPAPGSALLRGWGGVALTIVLLVVLIGAALLLQTRKA
jgi:mono/diheme cytochrome c family protein